MAHRVLTDANIWLAEYDLTADMNAIDLQYVAEAKDDTCFGDGTETNLGGVRSTAMEASGHWEAENSDVAIQGVVGVADKLITVSPNGAAEGDVAYFFKSLAGRYTQEGQHGEIYAFTLSATGSGGELTRGTIMVSPDAAITATGTSTARNLGAVASGEKVYAGLHVISASGTAPTLDVTVDSDDAMAFTTGTTRITFTQATAATSEWASADGAITDTWWRIGYTLGGTSPSFTFIVTVGIK